MDFPIVDADTHVNEPPDLWERRMPRELRDRAPRVVDGPHGGKAWRADDGRTMAINRLVNTAGISATDWQLIPSGGYEEMRPGGWDPKARIGDMDVDMVDVHVLFPSYALLVSHSDDTELHVAVVRAYNDWLAEFCEYAPDRLHGVAMVPASGIEDALDELRRVRELPNIDAVVLQTWPNGDKLARHADDDRFWAAAADLDIGVCAHVGFDIAGEAMDSMDDPEMLMAMATLPFINREKLAIDAMPILSEMVLGGVLDRHPRLRFGLVEVGVGWLPFFMEQSDDNYMRHRFWTHTELTMPPSEYWRRQCYATFQVDPYGISNRERVGIETIMWSSDYPHAGSDWPYARERIATQMRDVPEEEQQLVLGGNAARFYGLDLSRVAAARSGTGERR